MELEGGSNMLLHPYRIWSQIVLLRFDAALAQGGKGTFTITST